MENNTAFDALFRQAVSAVDRGDEQGLQALLAAYPQLATERLYEPGEWLTSVIPAALNSFFKDPYLLWFVSEDAVRNEVLPFNIARIAAIIVEQLKAVNAISLQEQLDYTLRLIAWSPVARNSGVQIGLLDVLIDAGAANNGISDDALVNGNIDAARHLVARGGKLTLASALCLGQWAAADDLATNATDDEKQFSLVLAALNGRAEAVTRALSYGAGLNIPCKDLYAHGTPLHHAVSSGSLDTVKVLVNAGACPNIKDSAFNSTPYDWAMYGNHTEIAVYLHGKVSPGNG